MNEVGQEWVLRDGAKGKVLWRGTTSAELQPVLSNLQQLAKWPNGLCVLTAPSGDELTVGIAAPTTEENPRLPAAVAWVSWQAGSGEPPYYVVVGDSWLDFESGGVIAFRIDGHWTEALRRNCVPVEVMLKIAKHYLETGSLAPWIQWEEV